MWQVGLEEEAEQAGSLRHRDRLQESSKWLLSARNRLTDRPQRQWEKESWMPEFLWSPEAAKYCWLGKQDWKKGHAFPPWAGCRPVFRLRRFEFSTLTSYLVINCRVWKPCGMLTLRRRQFFYSRSLAISASGGEKPTLVLKWRPMSLIRAL